MAPSFSISAIFSRSKAPIHRVRSGFTGFLTSTILLVPFSSSAISWTMNGFTVVLAPIQSKSTSYSSASFIWSRLATSVVVFSPVTSFTFFSQFSPISPTPSKPPGRVRGFQMPARKKSISLFFRFLAVSSICSSVSALQGPLMMRGLLRFRSFSH